MMEAFRLISRVSLVTALVMEVMLAHCTLIQAMEAAVSSHTNMVVAMFVIVVEAETQ